VLSSLEGQVFAKNGVATLSNIFFSAPGTLAKIQGTYDLPDRKIDLHGILHTNGKLSDTTSGFKALVLKALGPFLKKKSVTVVSFKIAGTSSNPSFALDFTGKSQESSRSSPKQ
jgi:hypothetical protein